MGSFKEIQTANRATTSGYDPGIYSFVRWSDEQKLIITTNLSWLTTSTFELQIPADMIKTWNLKDGKHQLKDQLYGTKAVNLHVHNGIGIAKIEIAPLETFIFEVKSWKAKK